ncbi:hypothetical protein [Variovorax sp. 278MFTsu5.1]|uniref:hypothetical protein n=1 Tax=Variovorax sp. 278MFTsu5.1 TaxID=3158366 RepID=UPI003AB00A0C
MTAQHTPAVGDYIMGRCVTMNTYHDGQVQEIVGTHGFESTLRYRIRAEGGRTYVVFHQGFAFRPATHAADARLNAAAWAAFDALTPHTPSASIVGLRQSDVSRRSGNVDERVSVSASGAQEEAAVPVDLGLDSSEHHLQSAVSALPHGSSPGEEGNGSAALAAPQEAAS